MEPSFVIAQVFSVQGAGHTKVVSISPGYKTIWAIPIRAFTGNPASGSMQFIPQVGSELLGDLYAESFNHEHARRYRH
jgi:hypothetical protein